MPEISLGADLDTRERIGFPTHLLRTHLHLIGATGAGKTTAVLTMLRSLIVDPNEQCALFVIDPMGNLSQDLLALIANDRYCPQHVRDRVVYIEPAREDIVLPFNPLTHTSEASRYYQTMRAVDIVLRAWEAQNVAQQPRLLQWLYKSFCAAAVMGLPIAMCRFLLHPGTAEHEAILGRLPAEIAAHWNEILRARGSEAVKILESTRNRLDPFFESISLRRMFGCTHSRFNCERFIKERRIVILNTAEYGRLPSFIGDTIGALALNEIFQTAHRLTTTEGRAVVEPTYILMDEFQRFVGIDIKKALPTVRQMGLRLMLAHQSFSQLEREDVDLTHMIWQAQSRLIFSNNARDADLVADELAKWTFYPKRVKDIRRSAKQLITGYRKEWLASMSSTTSSGSSNNQSESTGYGRNRSETEIPGKMQPNATAGRSEQESAAKGRSETSSYGETSGQSQANVPIHRTFREVSNITFESFDEFAVQWGQWIRQLKTGQAYLQLANSDRVRKIKVDHVPFPQTPKLLEAIARLKERNFASDFFISAAEADREAEQCRLQLFEQPPIRLESSPENKKADPSDDSPPSSPFEL
jgi:hypothetical protein